MSKALVLNPLTINDVGPLDVKPLPNRAAEYFYRLMGLMGSKFGKRMGAAFKLDKQCTPNQLAAALERSDSRDWLKFNVYLWDKWWQGNWGINAPVDKRSKVDTIAKHNALVEAFNLAIDNGKLEEVAAIIRILAKHHFDLSAKYTGGKTSRNLYDTVQLIVKPAMTTNEMLRMAEVVLEASHITDNTDAA